MNITMNSASLPASGDAALKEAASADSLPLDPALAAAQPGVPAPLPFLQFMQFMQADGALPAEASAEASPEQPAADGVPVAEAQEKDSGSGDAAQPLLAAMNMPLMPSMMATPSALPAMRLGAGMQERSERAGSALPSAASTTAAGALPLPSTANAAAAIEHPSASTARAAAVELPLAAAREPAAAQVARALAGSAAPGDGADRQAAPNTGAGDANIGDATSGDANAGFVVAPAATGAPQPQRGGAALSLSGPPAAWRQSLQEALGERLNLQLGKNAEQAVIRLDPPMLGRVEISIRHAAGSLEVNITATHSEVLRQLNTVSDNLRSDLAQRQYTDVSVNVSQATPRTQAGAQAGAFGAGFADQQGRGRQQGQDQDERAPGTALAEANQSTTAFSLSGRA